MITSPQNSGNTPLHRLPSPEMSRDRLPIDHYFEVCKAKSCCEKGVELVRSSRVESGVPQASTQIEVVLGEGRPHACQLRAIRYGYSSSNPFLDMKFELLHDRIVISTLVN